MAATRDGLAAQMMGIITLPAGFTLDMAIGNEGAGGMPDEGGGKVIYEAPELPRPARSFLLCPTPRSAAAPVTGRESATKKLRGVVHLRVQRVGPECSKP